MWPMGFLLVLTVMCVYTCGIFCVYSDMYGEHATGPERDQQPEGQSTRSPTRARQSLQALRGPQRQNQQK